MAYVTAEFEHPIYDVKIQVLQPTEDENGFEDGLYTNLEIDDMQEFNTSALISLSEWIRETAQLIDKDFNEDGSKKA